MQEFEGLGLIVLVFFKTHRSVQMTIHMHKYTHARGISFVVLAPAYTRRYTGNPRYALYCTMYIQVQWYIRTLEEATPNKQCIHLLIHDHLASKGLTNLSSQ